MKKTITLTFDVADLLYIFTVAGVDSQSGLVLDKEKFLEKLDDSNFIDILGNEMIDTLRREAEMASDYFIENEDFAELYIDEDGEDC